MFFCLTMYTYSADKEIIIQEQNTTENANSNQKLITIDTHISTPIKKILTKDNLIPSETFFIYQKQKKNRICSGFFISKLILFRIWLKLNFIIINLLIYF